MAVPRGRWPSERWPRPRCPLRSHRGRAALVGDAAGLINPLQGEGISQAMRSGRAAAEAVLGEPAAPAMHYRAWIESTYSPFLSVAAPAHGALLPRPRVTAAVGRLVTAP